MATANLNGTETCIRPEWLTSSDRIEDGKILGRPHTLIRLDNGQYSSAFRDLWQDNLGHFVVENNRVVPVAYTKGDWVSQASIPDPDATLTIDDIAEFDVAELRRRGENITKSLYDVFEMSSRCGQNYVQAVKRLTANRSVIEAELARRFDA